MHIEDLRFMCQLINNLRVLKEGEAEAAKRERLGFS